MHLKAGDQHAFREIYRRYWYTLYQVAKRKVRAEEDAEEIIQDIFVDLWERRNHIVIDELSSYLYKAVKYQTLKYIRAALVRQSHQDAVLKNDVKTDSQTEEELALNDLHAAISTGLENLPSKSREIFRLNRLEGRSVTEISNLLQIPERTVEYHITKSLRVMRMYLKDFIWGVILLISLRF